MAKLTKKLYLCYKNLFKANHSKMFQIDDTIVSPDVIEKNFICNLSVCKGECCIEGDAGAPLEDDEVGAIEAILPIIWNDLSPKAQTLIESQGVAYKDYDGEMVTSIVNNKDCVFTYYDDKGVCLCAIEKAHREGKSAFYKPISCHLYPIRLQKYSEFTAVNYHKWSICNCALTLGAKEGLKIYQFLKEPLVRKFGEKWYNELDAVAIEHGKAKANKR